MRLGKLEMKALVSIATVIIIFTGAVIYIGNKNHWLTPTVAYKTSVSDGDSLRVGGKVTLAGLRVGQIIKLDVDDTNNIEIEFEVYKSKANKITVGTQARIVRAFLIGEKSIDLLPGPKNAKVIAPRSTLKGIDSMEIPDLIAGKNMGQIFSKFDGVSKSLNKLLSAINHFSSNIQTEEFTETWKLVPPLLKNTNKLTVQLTSNKLIKKTLEDTRKVLRPLKKNSDTVENLLIETNHLVKGLAKNPQFAEEISVALKEVILPLKAAQKTWFLEDHVEKLKKKKGK
jgi:phospholipid/cholesterol/gamma-HCH transport system substrate-binding protein